MRTFSKAFGTVFAAAAIATALAPAAGAATVAGSVPTVAQASASGTITPDFRRNPCKNPFYRRHHKRECRHF